MDSLAARCEQVIKFWPDQVKTSLDELPGRSDSIERG